MPIGRGWLRQDERAFVTAPRVGETFHLDLDGTAIAGSGRTEARRSCPMTPRPIRLAQAVLPEPGRPSAEYRPEPALRATTVLGTGDDLVRQYELRDTPDVVKTARPKPSAGTVTQDVGNIESDPQGDWRGSTSCRLWRRGRRPAGWVGGDEQHTRDTSRAGTPYRASPQGRKSTSTETFDATEGEVVAFRCAGKRFLPIFLASFVGPKVALKLVRD